MACLCLIPWQELPGMQTPLLGCDGHLPCTGQLLLAVCNRLRRCCCRIGRHPQGRKIQRTGRPVRLPAHCICCRVSWSHELWYCDARKCLADLVPCRSWSENFSRVWRLEMTGKPLFCFNAFLFCYFGLILFSCTAVLSWTTARSISLAILSHFISVF